MDGVDEGLGVHWLTEEIVCTELPGLLTGIGIIAGRYSDDGHVGVAAVEFGLELKARLAGKGDVQKQTARLKRAVSGEEFFRRGKGLGRETG